MNVTSMRLRHAPIAALLIAALAAGCAAPPAGPNVPPTGFRATVFDVRIPAAEAARTDLAALLAQASGDTAFADALAALGPSGEPTIRGDP